MAIKSVKCSYVIIVLFDDRLVESGRLLELILLHEEHVSDVELPSVVLVAELHRLPEDLLHLRVVLHIPVDLGLLHQDRDVPVSNVTNSVKKGNVNG